MGKGKKKEWARSSSSLGLLFPFLCSYSLILATSIVGAGYLSLSLSIASAMMPEMARLRKVLWSPGMTNQGACFRLV